MDAAKVAAVDAAKERTVSLPEKENTTEAPDEVVYTAKAHTTCDRENGSSRSSGGRLHIKLLVPGSAHRHQSGAALSRRLVGLLRKFDRDFRSQTEDASARGGDRRRSRSESGEWRVFHQRPLQRQSARS